jgi:threonine/homoserine/homoserine lactone efflux protein
MPFYILKGLVIGFSIAAPVGPIGLLCIRRSMAEGQRVGLVTGLGAATADAGLWLRRRFWPDWRIEFSRRPANLA